MHLPSCHIQRVRHILWRLWISHAPIPTRSFVSFASAGGRQGLLYLQHHTSCTFADDEPGSVIIKWPRGEMWLVVELRGQTSRSGKAADCQGMNTSLGTSSNHDICFTSIDKSRCVAQGMGTCCTCGGDGVVGTLGNTFINQCRSAAAFRDTDFQTISHRYMARPKVDQQTRHE